MHRNPHHHMRDLRLKAIPVVYGFQFNVLFLISAIITFGNTGILRGLKISQLNGVVVLALLIFWCIFIFTSPERLDYQYREIAEKITKNRLFSARSNSLFFGSMYVTAIAFVKCSNRNELHLKVTLKSP